MGHATSEPSLYQAVACSGDSSLWFAGASGRAAGGHSSLVSPESSVGGLSEHQYQWQSNPAAVPGLHNMQSSSAYDATPHQQPSGHEQPKARPQLPDLDSSQPGPIEIDTSLLYTPQSGNSSTDVSQTGMFLHITSKL